MNKFISQSLDKLALALFAPSFTPASELTICNEELIEKPVAAPMQAAKTPKVFQKAVANKDEIDIFHYAFESRTQTSFSKNNTVQGRYFKLKRELPKSTVIVLHGLCENSRRYVEQHAASLIRSGHNCLTMALPYHFERSGNRSQNGSQLMGPDLRVILEGLKQAVEDVLSLVSWLTSNGEQRIGILGINVGGYVAALASSITRKLDFAILVAPLTTPIEALGFSVNDDPGRDSTYLLGLSKGQLNCILEPWELANNKPATPGDRLLLLAAAHTSFSSQESIEKLWRAWGKPQMRNYQFGYVGLRWSRRVTGDICRFINHTFSNKQSAGLLN